MKVALWPVCVAGLIAMAPAPHEGNRIDGALVVLDPSVTVRCPLTVGGSFEAKSKALSGELALDPDEPGTVDGTLAVDLRTLQTGIGLRDTHMRERYLEVQKGDGYSWATLSRIHLDGIDPAMPVGRVSFRGSLRVHGEERDVHGTADIRPSNQNLRVQASFPVRVSDFAIANPTYLGVGVRNEVTVEVSFQAAAKRRSLTVDGGIRRLDSTVARIAMQPGEIHRRKRRDWQVQRQGRRRDDCTIGQSSERKLEGDA